MLGTAAAVSIGFMGLSTWKRQQRGTSEFDLARNAIKKAYEVQQAIQGVRNPMIHLNAEEVENGNRLEEEQRIYQERLNRLEPLRAELQTFAIESKVLWGSEAIGCFEKLNKVYAELNAGIWMHFWLKGAYAGPGATVDGNPDRVIENDKIVYFIDENDEFTVKIREAISEIENYYVPKIRGKRLFFGKKT